MTVRFDRCVSIKRPAFCPLYLVLMNLNCMQNIRNVFWINIGKLLTFSKITQLALADLIYYLVYVNQTERYVIFKGKQ